MTREELVQLRDALDVTLALPDSIRELLAQSLAPPKASRPGKGHDPHPPPPPVGNGSGIVSEPQRRAKRHRRKPISARTAERKLIEAMRDNPGLTVIALANAAGSGRSTTGERLRQLADRGVVEKDTTGRWKLKVQEKEPGPTSPPSI
jgi:hypothetical protein